MAQQFRFGGKGGWDTRGQTSTGGKEGIKFQVNFNKIELKRFMGDLKTQYPLEFKKILKEAFQYGF